MSRTITKTYGTGELIRRFLPYLMKYRKLLLLDLGCASLTTLCDIVLPRIMSTLTNTAMYRPASLTAGLIGRLALLYTVLRLLDAAAYYYMCSQGHIMGVYIETDMRTDAFRKLETLSDSYYSNTKIGQIMGRITADLFDITEFAHHCPEEFFIAAIKITVSFVILCFASVPLTLIIFACVPFMLLASVRLNHRFRSTTKSQRVELGELNAQVEDALLGERVVKAFTAEDEELRKLEAGNQKMQNIKKERYYAMADFNMSTRLFDGLMYSVTIIAGGLFLVRGRIQAGDLVAYILYVTTLIATIRRIVEFAEQFSQGITGVERFLEIMDTPVDITDRPGARNLVIRGGDILFDHVTFEYPDDHNRVLHDLCLEIHPGENLALVGESGGGKTTLSALIPRFYDVTDGAVRIDGQDVRDVKLYSLRSQIGIVQQEVYLFSGTVAENIAYGKPGASREEIVRAAKLAGADSFIRDLRDGYDSYVGERGIKLSGGQKQRISIARVFLKNPPILLLDEATSALDNESEILIERSLRDLSEGRTTLTIAHRLTTIQHADRIVVLGKSGIEEEGSHQELLAKKGTYYRLWNGVLTEDEAERKAI
ncbi:ABC transporter ATP-binding protein [Lachnoclostridium sp. Marseille-P6806]|uniref:ABC transporter ATP-binding protein n=1 Tax=Lachnoclostridium sp. Marseille-P6806 TaxID=2364793 RepID=UPI0010314A79|nr:ABC transporter ATP-binding protein [Lachnoclostridium sp. Marseille-P6806]